MSDTPRVAAGWYPDPLGIPQLRWWDNHAWTEHVSDRLDGLAAPEVIDANTRTALRSSAPPDPAAPSRPRETATTPVTTTTSAATSSAAPSVTPAATASAAPTTTTATATLERDTGEQPSGESEWIRVAAALQRALAEPYPQTVEITSDDFARLLVDTAERAFWWPHDLADFPTHPRGTTVTVRAEGPAVRRVGDDLDPLLWRIGRAAFGKALAPWLDPSHRIKLRRWPNLTELPHTDDELQMISMLGHASLTVRELAAIAEVTLVDATRLVSTFSLMGLIRVTPAVDESTRPAEPERSEHATPASTPATSTPASGARAASAGAASEDTPRRGLFRRLRDALDTPIF